MSFVPTGDHSLGILQSGIHWAWFTAKCSTLTARFRYTSDTVFDTFPWPPSPTLAQVKAVAEASVSLRALRREIMVANGWSLRDLYRSLEAPGTNYFAPFDGRQAVVARSVRFITNRFIRVPKIEMTKPDGFYAEYEFGRERFFLFGDANNKKKVIQGDVCESEQVPSMAPQWMQKNGQLGIYDPRKEPKFTVLREPAIIMDLDDGTVTNFGEVEDLKAPLKNWMAHHREHKGSWVVAFIRVDTIPASYLNIMFGDPAYAKQLGWAVIEQSIKNGSMDGRIKAEPHLEWLTRRFPNLTEDQLQRSRKNWSPEQFDRLEQANYDQDPTPLAPGL